MKSIFSSLFPALKTNEPRPMEPGRIYNIHLRNFHPDSLYISSKGGVSVAVRLNADGTLEAAAAICSANDNFCRKTGRELAQKRLDSKEARFYRVYDAKEHSADKINEFCAVEDAAYTLTNDIGGVVYSAHLVERYLSDPVEYDLLVS